MHSQNFIPGKDASLESTINTERWFVPREDGSWPPELLNPELHAFYNPNGSIDANDLVEFNSGNVERGICTLPYVRQRDGAVTYVRQAA